VIRVVDKDIAAIFSPKQRRGPMNASPKAICDYFGILMISLISSEKNVKEQSRALQKASVVEPKDLIDERPKQIE
jgi:hypothetical protein